jgi:putative FmdB family regulatory protein
MPLYEFICKKCGQQFEELKDVNDFAAKCPICDSDTEKIMSATSFVVSGSTNRSIDSIVGEDSEKRWQQIRQNKKQRDDQKYKGLPEVDIKAKEQNRLSSVLNRQQEAYNVLDKAKKQAGITKKDELNHLLK